MPKLYGEAETVEAVASRIIPTYHSELATARIRYIGVDTAGKKNGRPVWGKVRRVSGAMEYLLEQDFIMEVPMDTWNEMNEAQRTALVDHLLERCTGEEDEKTGDMKWVTREPDVQEFTTILRRHGAWTVDLEGLVSVAQEIKVEERVQEIEEEVVAPQQTQGTSEGDGPENTIDTELAEPATSDDDLDIDDLI